MRISEYIKLCEYVLSKDDIDPDMKKLMNNFVIQVMNIDMSMNAFVGEIEKMKEQRRKLADFLAGGNE